MVPVHAVARANVENVAVDQDIAVASIGRTRADLVRLEEAGIEAVLIGEAIMRADDIGNKVRELLGFEGTLPPGLRPHVDLR